VYGRRRPLLIGLTLYLGASVATALAPSVEFMLVPRVVQGCTSASVVIIGQASLRDLLSASRRESVTRWMGMVRSAAPLLAPVIGSLLQALCGWRANFWALAALGAGLLLSSLLSLPESLPLAKRQPRFGLPEILRALAFLLRRRDFMCWAVPEAVGFSAFFMWIATSSYLLQGFYGISVELFGVLYSACFIGATLGSYSTTCVRQRLGLSPSATYLLGASVQTSAASVLGLLSLTPLTPIMSTPSVTGEVLLQTCMFALMCGRSLCMVQAQVQALEPFPTRAAAAAGLMGALRSAMVACVSALAGFVLKASGGTPVGTCRAVLALSVLSHASHLLLRPWRARAGESGTRSTRTANARMINTTASQVSEEALTELRAAHEAVRSEMKQRDPSDA